MTNRINKTGTPDGGVEPGRAEAYALELDSATAVRVLNQLVGAGGLTAELAEEDFPARTGGTLPAGTVLFAADPATRVKLATAGRENGLLFRRIVSEDYPSDRSDRRLAAHRRDHGRREPGRLVAAEPRVRREPGREHDDDQQRPTDPLAGYDVVWNTGNYPSTAQTTARARFQAFFAAGGGYIGTGTGGANFLTTGALTSGLTVATSVGR